MSVLQTVYRIENEDTMHGMWYRGDGTFDPFINKLTDGKSASLPMGFNERYYKEGAKWFSGCGNIDDMKTWFSDLDALELYMNDYKLYIFQSKQFSIEEHEVMFTREGVLSKIEIPIESIWNIHQFARRM